MLICAAAEYNYHNTINSECIILPLSLSMAKDRAPSLSCDRALIGSHTD